MLLLFFSPGLHENDNSKDPREDVRLRTLLLDPPRGALLASVDSSCIALTRLPHLLRLAFGFLLTR